MYILSLFCRRTRPPVLYRIYTTYWYRCGYAPRPRRPAETSRKQARRPAVALRLPHCQPPVRSSRPPCPTARRRAADAPACWWQVVTVHPQHPSHLRSARRSHRARRQEDRDLCAGSPRSPRWHRRRRRTRHRPRRAAAACGLAATRAAAPAPPEPVVWRRGAEPMRAAMDARLRRCVLRDGAPAWGGASLAGAAC